MSTAWALFALVLAPLHSSLELETFHGSDLAINVLLYGFDEDSGCTFNLDSEKLSYLLHKVKPSRIPRFLDTGRAAGVKFSLDYRVIKAKLSDVSALFSSLKDQLKMSSEKISSTSHVIDIGSVHQIFSRQAVQYAHGFREQLTVFVINPDKRFLTGTEAHREQSGLSVSNCIGGYNYSYTFGSGQSCTWVGSESYVVIDLSAGPCKFGHLGKNSGSVSSFTFPTITSMLERQCLAEGAHTSECRLASVIERMKPQIFGLLCSAVSSAVDYVLVPDVAYQEPTFAKQVLVPILVFRETEESAMLSKFNIDVPQIKKITRRLLSGEQEVKFVTGTHSLHDHPMMTVAIHKAIREQGVCLLGNCSSSRRFISSRDLLKELHHTHDLLAEGLLSDHKDFFPSFDDEVGIDWLSPATLQKVNRYLKSIRADGSRVVPVYVFSVSSLGNNLLLDMESQVAWSSNAVLVLHSPCTKDSLLPFFVGNRRLSNDAEDVTRSILSGLSASLGSVAPPYLHHSEIVDQIETDYLWAVGFHPFTPFSGTTQLSRHYDILALRNTVLSQLRHVVDAVVDARKCLNDFKKKHLHDLHEDESDHHLADSADSEKLVSRLSSTLHDFEDKIKRIISNLKFSKLSQAATAMNDLASEARMQMIHFQLDLSGAESEKACCSVKYYGSTISLFELTGVPVALTGIILLMVWFVWAYLR